MISRLPGNPILANSLVLPAEGSKPGGVPGRSRRSNALVARAATSKKVGQAIRSPARAQLAVVGVSGSPDAPRESNLAHTEGPAFELDQDRVRDRLATLHILQSRSPARL